MKRLLTSVAVLGLAAWGAKVASANELFNPNLDAVAIGPQNGNTPVGWAVEASKTISGTHFDGVAAATFANVFASGGFGLFFKPFQGNRVAGDYITVHVYQDNLATPGAKYTLSGYATGEANYCGHHLTNTPTPASLFVVQFLDASSIVLASNVFDLKANGLPIGGGGAMLQLTMPQVTAPVGTATVRAGASMIDAYSTGGAQSFFVDSFNLAIELPDGSPVITNQPAATTVTLGGNAAFNVGVSNTAGVSYEWRKDGVVLVDGGTVSGATTPTLTITGATLADLGHYRVRVSNGVGSLYSANAPLARLNIVINPVIHVTGKINDTYRVDYATSLAPTTWIPLSTNRITTGTFQVVDPVSALTGTRFYRAVYLP